MNKKQMVAVGFLVVSVVTWALHKMNVFYVPGLTDLMPALTALTLCVAMAIVGADMLIGTGKRKNTSRRLAAILVLAFALFNLVVGGMEIYNYIIRL